MDFPAPAAAAKPSPPHWVRLVIVLAVGSALACGLGLAVLIFVGARGPDTKVYSGRELPARFVSAVKSKVPLERDERILFFYSDALLDVADSFSLVSDRRVVVHDAERAQPTASLPFGEIASASLSSSDSWAVDGAITLVLTGGEELEFAVSSEDGRDKKFLAAIQDGLERGPGHEVRPTVEKAEAEAP